MPLILQDILQHVGQDHPIEQIEVCAHWILVTSLHSGMASTVIGCKPHGEELVADAGSLLEKSALEVAQLSLSNNPLEAGIGLAAINSLLKPPTKNVKEINIAKVLVAEGKDKKIALIGHFPFIPKLKEIAKELWVIDLQPAEGEFSPQDAQRLLPEADILAMTANTLITKAAEYYLDLCRPAALKIMLGPSTPLTPILFDHGLDILAGVRVTDAQLVHRYIAQGAAFSQVKGIDKLTITK